MHDKGDTETYQFLRDFFGLLRRDMTEKSSPPPSKPEKPPYSSATFEDRLAERAMIELMRIHQIHAGSTDPEFDLVAGAAYKMAQHMIKVRKRLYR